MGAQWSQFFPPKPGFKAADFGTLEDRVFLITGGYSGIGLQLAKILYSKNATVYIAGRSDERGLEAVATIRASAPVGGTIEFLHVDLEDLSSIKPFVEAFKAKEDKLHVLWNNAGVSQPPVGSVSKQGMELQLAVNCVGPFLLTQLLLPLLQATSGGSADPGSVRVVWSSSQMVELSAPQHGIIMEEVKNPPQNKTRNYVNSKTGNMFLAAEFAHRYGPSHGIISVAQNPGACHTNLFRHSPWLPYLARPLMHGPELGALTALFSGLSKEINPDSNGCYIIPWGRISNSVRKDLVDAMRPESEGGSGRSSEFWEFCEEASKSYR